MGFFKKFSTIIEALNTTFDSNEPEASNPKHKQVIGDVERISIPPITTFYYTDNHMVEDLIALVGQAIDEWAGIHHLENLPPKIIFQQALSILNAIDKIIFID